MVTVPTHLAESPPMPAPAAVPAGSAHAKAIVIGEHAAVYGHPAIALPITPLRTVAEVHLSPGPLRLNNGGRSLAISELPQRFASVGVAATTALKFFGLPAENLEIAVRSGIPPQAGLGASAAAANAIVEAVRAYTGRALDEATRFELVQTAERVAHGNPSGIDTRATRAPDPFLFSGGVVTALPLRVPVWFVVADTGVRSSTDGAVAGVRQFVDADPDHGSALLTRLGSLTREAATDLEHGHLTDFGKRLTIAQETLTELTVGHPAIDRLVAAAVGPGRAGAGRGGCVIAVATDAASAEQTQAAMTAAGAVAVWTVAAGAT